MQKVLSVILFFAFLFAKELTFVEEYTYQVNENDSKVTARANALKQVRELLLEEVSIFFIDELDFTREKTYIDGQYINKDIYKQNIKSIIAEIIEIKVIYQKWNTKTYLLQGKISLNADIIGDRFPKIIDKNQNFLKLDETKNNGKDLESNKSVISILPDSTSINSENHRPDTSITPNIKIIAFDIPPKPIIPIKPIYPTQDKESGIEGTIYIQYFIDNKGNVTEALVIEGIPNSGLNEAALSAVKNSSWEPALQGEKKVGVWQTVPVKFELKSN